MVNKTVKTLARGGINATIVAAELSKFGISLEWKLAKSCLGGAKSLANQFTGEGLNLGIGDTLFDITETVADKSSKFAISQMKNLRGCLR